MRLEHSPLKTKKWRAVFRDGTHTDFGDPNYEDYTQHHDAERRRRYKMRHEKDLDTRNPKAAGFLSYFLLWGDSTSLDANLKSYKRKFGDL
jgi:hypothetical protein